jgi:hypothetical protein
MLLGFILGLSIAPVFAWGLAKRLVERLTRNLTVEVVAARLQTAREAYDFGRDTAPVPGAGPAGDQSNLFPTYPGKMTLEHLKRC